MKGIYRLISPSGKSYIGQSVDLQKRLRQYKSLSCKDQPKIYNALMKYGFENFKVEILFKTNKDYKYSKLMLDALEVHFIKQFDCINNGYNIKTGGNNLRTKHSEETKEKLRDAAIKQFESQEARDKVGAAKRGKTLSEEHKKKCSDALKGRIFTEEHRLNLSKAGKGKKISEEQKIKLSKANSKAIIQYDIYGNFMREFESATTAAKELGISRSTITNRLANKTKNIKDYTFKYKL